MKRPIAYIFFRGSLSGMARNEEGEPQILFNVHVREKPLVRKEWERILAEGQELITFSGFNCARCSSQVIVCPPPARSGCLMQACQCTAVVHHAEALVHDVELWTRWQEEYETQKQHPLPDMPLLSDPLTGAPLPLSNEAGKTWLRERLGLPADVEISDDGNVFKIGNQRIDLADGPLRAYWDDDDPEASAKLGQTVAALYREWGCPPEGIVVLGNDPDYVWIDGTSGFRAGSLPFRCPNCKARVKWQPFGRGAYLGCFCMYLVLSPGARLPDSARAWGELYLEGKTNMVKSRARNAEGTS